jgi:hypothetical protein
MASLLARGVKIQLPEIGADFKYDAGTLLFFSSSLFTHAVPPWKQGIRVCYASFMRPEICKQFSQSIVEWPSL